MHEPINNAINTTVKILPALFIFSHYSVINIVSIIRYDSFIAVVLAVNPSVHLVILLVFTKSLMTEYKKAEKLDFSA